VRIFWRISGSPGTTLNINLNNANAGTSRFRLYGGFTNNANISLPPPVRPMRLPLPRCQPESGLQRRDFRQRSLYCAQRKHGFFQQYQYSKHGTYSVILSGGSIGLGVDTTYATPPAIQSSPVGTNDLAIDATAGNCTIIAEEAPALWQWHLLSSSVHQ